ncbi:uncharacterized protein MYCFIDRAFT_172205 [Pseudocercospora fijiensis CIRAD86]|uniref:Uncharacterized protein n=1 Tax=Pseudocercospora fijiensis (strain CIRAD86) TaxID=383855 RepID=M3BAX0_PSEFD|nr:uncharacterized protein MYCFIDRAFT_172205 [Pseudocercospora fijiensis CIRAD86]EME86457.1 hypothetical protein MYCFIDRAFT_172205 [Pseudocercospora fijiensis CIRAD86]
MLRFLLTSILHVAESRADKRIGYLFESALSLDVRWEVRSWLWQLMCAASREPWSSIDVVLVEARPKHSIKILHTPRTDASHMGGCE